MIMHLIASVKSVKWSTLLPYILYHILKNKMKMDIKLSVVCAHEKKPSHTFHKRLKTFETWVLRPESLYRYFELGIFFTILFVWFLHRKPKHVDDYYYCRWLAVFPGVSQVLCISVEMWWEWYIFNGQPSYWNKPSLPHWKPFSLLLFVYYFWFEIWNSKHERWTLANFVNGIMLNDDDNDKMCFILCRYYYWQRVKCYIVVISFVHESKSTKYVDLMNLLT